MNYLNIYGKMYKKGGDNVEQYMAFIWLGVALVMGVLEATTLQLVSIWFVLGGISAAITCVFTDDILVQVAVFICVSLVALLVTRPLVKKFTHFKKTETNADRYIGKTGKVILEINNELGQGQVNVEGSVWTARSINGNVIIPIDANVKVNSIEGVKLIVTPTKELINK